MIYQQIDGLDKPLARVIQGTIMLSRDRLEEGFALLDGVFERGGTTFDTAHGYGGGDADRVLGLWMEARGNRDRVVIVGKGCHHNVDRRRVTPYDLASDLMDTLARLRSDHVDLYLLHRDDPSLPVGPIMDALADHQEAGRIRAFGGSNWSPRRIQEANAYAEEHGLPPMRASSPNFSLAVQRREPWAECLSISGPDGAQDRDWYRLTRMPLLVWSSLAGGFFSGALRRDNLDTFTDYYMRLSAETYGTEDNFRRYDAANAIAGARGLSVATVALAYLFGTGLNVFPLVGARTVEEFAASTRAAELDLSAEEMAALELRSA
ncbi:MAG: aldo/keto reductase [Spirochaetaceae bacterium]|nr:aldo/keto reductase [Spirochaetaceae bacterium]